MAVGAAIATFVVAAGSTVMQQKQQRKAQAMQKKQMEENRAATAAQQSMEQAKDDQQRRQQIRERRMKQAMLMQSAENTGAGYSSGEIGGMGALSTDYFANMQYINSMGNLRTDAASAQTRANDAWFKATQYQNRASKIAAWGNVLQSTINAGMYGAKNSGNGGGGGGGNYNNTIDYSGNLGNGPGGAGNFGPEHSSINPWTGKRYGNYGFGSW